MVTHMDLILHPALERWLEDTESRAGQDRAGGRAWVARQDRAGLNGRAGLGRAGHRAG